MPSGPRMEYVTCKFNRHDEIFLYWGEKEKKEREPTHSRVFFSSSLCTHSSQLCSTLCEPKDCSLPGSSVLGILKARMLEWVAISSSRGSSPPRDRTCISCLGQWIVTAEPPGKSIMHDTRREKYTGRSK